MFLSGFPEVDNKFVDIELEARWKDLLSVRDDVNKALEIKRAEKFIGNPLEAKITLHLPERYQTLCESYMDFLPMFFLVSEVVLSSDRLTSAHEGSTIEGLQVLVERASGNKCLRCWNWSVSVGTIGEEPELCDRCYSVVK